MKPILFKRVRDVKLPTGNRCDDSGIDFFVPEFNLKFIDDFKLKNAEALASGVVDIDVDKKRIIVAPGGRVLIPSGIHVRLPELDNSDYKISLDFDNKSGIATKRGVTVGADIVDASYEGECHLSLFNNGWSFAVLEAGDKIVQAIPRIVANNPIEEFTGSLEEMYKDHKSNRGAGGFGSTGTK